MADKRDYIISISGTGDATPTLTPIDRQEIAATALTTFADDLDALDNYAALRAYEGPRNLVVVSGHTAPADGGGATFTTDGETNHTALDDDGGINIVDATGRLWQAQIQSTLQAARFGLIGGATVDASSYTVRQGTALASGEHAGLQAAINASQARDDGLLELSGAYYVEDNLDLNSGDNELKKANWSLSGMRPHGVSSVQFTNGDIGDAIFMAPEKTISGMIRGQRVDNLSIYGAVQDGPLFAAGIGPAQGGGFCNVTITNSLDAAPSGTPVGLEVGAFFIGRTSDLVVYGARNFRPRFNDVTIPSAELFWGVGVHYNTDGGGSGEAARNLTASGHNIGVRVGTDVGESISTYAHIQFTSLQCNYNNVGIELCEGAVHVEILHPHFEFNTDCDVKIHKGAGSVFIRGGGSSYVNRGSEVKRDAVFIVGNPVLADCEFKYVEVSNFQFFAAGNQNAGALVYGGTDGLLVFRDNVYTGGGARVVIDETNGPANVWIQNGHDHAHGGPVADTTRWITEIVRGDAYTPHTYIDASHKGRIEGVSFNTSSLPSGGGLDFTGRKVIPWGMRANTLGGNVVVTLSPTVLTGQYMHVQKRNGANALSFEVPAGSFYTGRDGARTAGPATVTEVPNTELAFVTVTKFNATEWFSK